MESCVGLQSHILGYKSLENISVFRQAHSAVNQPADGTEIPLRKSSYFFGRRRRRVHVRCSLG